MTVSINVSLFCGFSYSSLGGAYSFQLVDGTVSVGDLILELCFSLF